MIVPAALLVVSLAALPQSTQPAAAPLQPATEPAPRVSGTSTPEVDFRRFPQVLASTFTRGLFTPASLPVVTAGALGTAVIYPFDQRWSDAWGGQAPWIGRAAGIIGGPTVVAGVGGMLVVAPFTHNATFRAIGFTMGQAFVLETALTEGLKLAVGRTRPNGSNTYSFPSGHTAGTFMVATVLNHNVGWKVGIPAYAIATFVAIGRIESRDHYPSDTVAGAAIGILSATSAIRAVEHEAEGHVTISPMVGRRRVGVFVAITF